MAKQLLQFASLILRVNFRSRRDRVLINWTTTIEKTNHMHLSRTFSFPGLEWSFPRLTGVRQSAVRKTAAKIIVLTSLWGLSTANEPFSMSVSDRYIALHVFSAKSLLFLLNHCIYLFIYRRRFNSLGHTMT